MNTQQGLMGIFAYLDDLLSAVKIVKEKNFKIETVYSPIRSHEIIEALGMKPSPVRHFTLVGALLGIVTGVGLAVYTAMQWRFIVSGKPPIPSVPYVIVAFEFCILFGVLWNLVSLWVNARLPKIMLPSHYDPRFTEDRFGVVVLCAESEREAVAVILSQAGAEEVHDVQE